MSHARTNYSEVSLSGFSGPFVAPDDANAKVLLLFPKSTGSLRQLDVSPVNIVNNRADKLHR